jgi:hypothetical protein
MTGNDHTVRAQDHRAKAWRVQAVSVSAGSFENRKSLPAAWMGLRDAELSAAAGIPDCIFVHASGEGTVCAPYPSRLTNRYSIFPGVPCFADQNHKVNRVQ